MNAVTTTMNISDAQLEMFKWSHNAEAMKESDLYVWMNKVGVPHEINIRLVELWGVTREIAGQVVHLGKIIIKKIIEFVSAHPHAAIGMCLGAALGALTSLIPFIGQFIAPLATAVGAFLGGVSGSPLDHPEANSAFQGLVLMAKDFFVVIAEVFIALKDLLLN